MVHLSANCRQMLDAPRQNAASPSPRKSPLALVTVTKTPTTFQRIPTRTPMPLWTRTPRPTVPSYSLPTANRYLDFCAERNPPDDDLLTIVTTKYGLSATYQPGDLVQRDQSLSYNAVYGPGIRLRAVALTPLVNMIHAMQTEGLHPIIFSAFRDYAEQKLSYEKWLKQDAKRASAISALPGHSEHQLGLALDFGSPDLAELVGDPGVQFHADFARTGEGVWLIKHAQEYGFSMSYPRAAFEVAGFEYEPWYYRYVALNWQPICGILTSS